IPQLGLHRFVQPDTVFDGRQQLTRLGFLLKGPSRPDSADGDGRLPAARGPGARGEPRVARYVDGTQKYADGGFDTMNKESRQHNRLLAMGYKVIRFKFNEVMSLFTFRE